MINLTPHDIKVNDKVYPASGDVARVTVSQEDTGFQIDGAPVRKNTYGDVMVGDAKFADLYPNGMFPCEVVLVSGMVLDALRAQGYMVGVYAPDTGPTAVRNDKGHIDYVTGLIGL